jgi:intracellular septation protein A
MNRVPEPALIRSAIVAVTGVLAVVLGRQIDISWLDTVVTLYAALSPILAGWLIRRVVSPVDAGRHAKLEE